MGCEVVGGWRTMPTKLISLETAIVTLEDAPLKEQ
jgi:hypothetical protein